MLPFHYQTIKNDIQGYNRAIMLTSDLQFGLGIYHDKPLYLLDRLNTFIENSKTSLPYDFYLKYRPDGIIGTKHLKINNPDMYGRDTNKTGAIHRHIAGPQKISLHDLRKTGDPIYKSHWVTSNTYERSLLKLMSDLDESVILSRTYIDPNEDDVSNINNELRQFKSTEE